MYFSHHPADQKAPRVYECIEVETRHLEGATEGELYDSDTSDEGYYRPDQGYIAQSNTSSTQGEGLLWQ
jgi:hypothetical protein